MAEPFRTLAQNYLQDPRMDYFEIAGSSGWGIAPTFGTMNVIDGRPGTICRIPAASGITQMALLWGSSSGPLEPFGGFALAANFKTFGARRLSFQAATDITYADRIVLGDFTGPTTDGAYLFQLDREVTEPTRPYYRLYIDFLPDGDPGGSPPAADIDISFLWHGPVVTYPINPQYGRIMTRTGDRVIRDGTATGSPTRGATSPPGDVLEAPVEFVKPAFLTQLRNAANGANGRANWSALHTSLDRFDDRAFDDSAGVFWTSGGLYAGTDAPGSGRSGIQPAVLTDGAFSFSGGERPVYSAQLEFQYNESRIVGSQ